MAIAQSRRPARLAPSRRLSFLLLATALLATGQAKAQPAVFTADGRPTRGLEVPAGPLVGRASATALELNPGQLGMVEGLSLDILANYLPDASAWPGRGTGLFLALPAGALTLGGSLQWLTPPGDAPRHVKSQVGLALSSSSRFGIGLTWNHFFTDDTPVLDALDSFDLGVTIRPFRFVGLGAVVRDLFQPQVAGPLRLQRVYEGELALRPLGVDRFEIAGGVRIGEDRKSTGYRVRLAAELLRGVRLLGELAQVPVDIGGRTVDDRRATLALGFDFNHAGLTVAGYGRRFGDGSAAGGFGEDNGGFGVLFSLHRARHDSVIPDRRIEKVDLEDVEDETDFLRLVVRLQRLAADPDVSGVLLDLDGLSGAALGLGLIEELREQLTLLRARGKQSYAFFTDINTRGYYLAAACDRIYMQPAGTLALNGLGSSTTFFKGALDRIGVSVDLVRVGRYKGAMEPFVNTGFSEAVGDNWRQVIDLAGGQVTAGVASGRPKLHTAAVQKLMEKGIFSAEEAKQAGLIDEIKHLPELTAIDGRSIEDPDDAPAASRRWALPKVAVVVIPGPIVDGDSTRLPLSSGETAGARTVVANLDRAAADGRVRAVVLRVNSPGGSVTASEDIARAIKKVRAAGKPVYVSMGDVAASGGYYVAAPADRIFASPSTLTGSIGIYTYHVDATALMTSLGLTVESHATAERALAMQPSRPWSGEDFALMQKHIESLYQLFLRTVSEGRKPLHASMTPERVDELGRGLVLTGAQAKPAHLVDQMGGFMAALRAAARKARMPLDDHGLPDIVIYPNVSKPMFQVAVSPTSLFTSPAQTEASALLSLVTRALGDTGRVVLRLLAPVLTGARSHNMALAPILWAPK